MWFRERSRYRLTPATGVILVTLARVLQLTFAQGSDLPPETFSVISAAWAPQQGQVPPDELVANSTALDDCKWS